MKSIRKWAITASSSYPYVDLEPSLPPIVENEPDEDGGSGVTGFSLKPRPALWIECGDSERCCKPTRGGDGIRPILDLRISSGSGGKSFDSRDFGVGWREAGVTSGASDEKAVDDDSDGDVEDGEKAEIKGGVEEVIDDKGFSGDVDGLDSVGGAGNEDVGGGGAFTIMEDLRLDDCRIFLLKRYDESAANVGSLFTGLRDMV